MATLKTVKKKSTRSKNIRSWIVLIFVLSVFLKLYTSLFVRTQQVTLNVQVQDTENKIAQLKSVNESLTIEVSQLSSYEHIAKVAKEAGLVSQQNNIVTIRDNHQ